MCCCTPKLQQHPHETGCGMHSSVAGSFIRSTACFSRLRTVHGITCEKRPLRSNAFLLTEISQTKTFSLPVKEVYLNLKSLFSYDPSNRKRGLSACARARAQRAICAVKRQLSLGKGMISPARSARKSPPPSASRNCRQLGKRAGIQSTRLDSVLALSTPPRKRSRPSDPHESSKVTIFVLRSRIVKERGWSKSCRGKKK